MIEKHWGYRQSFGVEFVKNIVRIVSPVEAANAGVIATDNKMGASIILADNRVKNRLARARVTHCRWIHGKQRPCPREVVLEHGFVATHTNLSRYVIRLCLAYQRVQFPEADAATVNSTNQVTLQMQLFYF